MNKQDLVIITGITGAIGNALLAKYAPNSVVYGISRKGLHFSNFINPKNFKFYPKTFISSIGELSEKNIDAFINSIDTNQFNSITYFHSLGLYPFEINNKGEYQVDNDKNGDGINDITYNLTYEVFEMFSSKIKSAVYKAKIPGRSLIFGSLADKHEPKAHYSWWQTMKKTREYMMTSATKDFGFHIINISSVSCAHEIITRPFIFIHTDAKIQYWLQPNELVSRIFQKIGSKKSFQGFHEFEIYNKVPEFNQAYYEDNMFTPRKIAELY